MNQHRPANTSNHVKTPAASVPVPPVPPPGQPPETPAIHKQILMFVPSKIALLKTSEEEIDCLVFECSETEISAAELWGPGANLHDKGRPSCS